MKKSILVYADDRTAIGSLIPSLRQSFSDSAFSIQPVGADELRGGALTRNSSRVLVLPGIKGNISRYRNDLGYSEIQRIKDFVGQSKNVLLTICAGTWHISRTVSFHLPGQPKKLSQCANYFFSGMAQGPYEPYTQPPGYSGPVVVPVKFRDQSGAWEESGVCYDKSPLLFPDNPDDPDMDIIAVYHKIPGNSVALLRLQFGEGAVYMSSMHPEIYYYELPDEDNLKNARKIMESLKPYEAGRQRLWSSLTDRIKMDLEG